MGGKGLSSAAAGERVFAFEAFAEQPAGTDIAFGVIGFGGVGKDYTGGGGGVDETENSGSGADRQDDWFRQRWKDFSEDK